MPLLPTSKVYRGFPELDRFSDGECTYLVKLARRENRVSRALAVLMAPAAALGTFILIMALCDPSDVTDRSARWEYRYYLALMLGLSVSPLVGGLAYLTLRDEWLRSAINTRLADNRCPGCSYSMLGLPLTGDVVLCPECGRNSEIKYTGLAPAPFATRADAEPGP